MKQSRKMIHRMASSSIVVMHAGYLTVQSQSAAAAAAAAAAAEVTVVSKQQALQEIIVQATNSEILR